MNSKEIQDRIKQLDKEIDNKIEEKYQLQKKHFELYELKKIKEKYMNKYYIYRDNCYSCPEKKSEYWNVYYKVIDVNEDGGIKAISLQKDKYGQITSEETMISINRLRLEEITEREYIRETSKILGVLQERFKEEV